VKSAKRLRSEVAALPCSARASNLPLIEHKVLLEPLLANKPGLQFNGHETGDGELIVNKLGFEGVISKTIDAPYAPGNRRLRRKAKALNLQHRLCRPPRGQTDHGRPEGSRARSVESRLATRELGWKQSASAKEA
jgi:hypothetical protein